MRNWIGAEGGSRDNRRQVRSVSFRCVSCGRFSILALRSLSRYEVLKGVARRSEAEP